ncbi:MAG: hypothetical protein M3133_01920, partial [Actinomycetota bacterium]|nr:hypothetical protein [Actinomycetota bacterium]
VEVRNGAVLIRDISVGDRTLVDLVERRLEQGIAAEDTITDALEIGARVLDREATAAEVDFVKREFDRVSAEVERSFADRAREVAEKLEDRFEHFFGEDEGAIARALDAHSGELAELTARHFGADRNTAVQHQLREVLSRALQEQRAELLKQFSSEDGHNPLADFKATVRREIELSREKHGALFDKMGDLEAEIRVLHEAQRGEQALSEERERGTGKGRSFEQRAFELVEEMTAARGDAALHVGDERSASGGKKGDIVIELDAGTGPCKGRIALDAKDEKLSKNDAWKVLNASLDERDAGFAILVVASEEKVPAGREPLHEYEGNKMIVTLDKETFDARPLELAYRYARCRALMAQERQLEVDAPGVRGAAQEALSALKDAQRIRGSLTGASNSVETARTALDAMVARVEASLERIEEMISAA